MPEENIEDNGWLIGTFQQNLDADIFPTNLSVLQVFFFIMYQHLNIDIGMHLHIVYLPRKLLKFGSLPKKMFKIG
jgi:hypothetical protein